MLKECDWKDSPVRCLSRLDDKCGGSETIQKLCDLAWNMLNPRDPEPLSLCREVQDGKRK